jgi:hypothetical protein
MHRITVKAVVVVVFLLLGLWYSGATQNPAAEKSDDLNHAVAYAVYLEAHASHLETKADVCLGLGHGLLVNSQEILSELNSRKLKVHPNEWCSAGPRGFVISVIPPITESAPRGTFEITIQVGDLHAIRENGEHFANLLKRGVSCLSWKWS